MTSDIKKRGVTCLAAALALLLLCPATASAASVRYTVSLAHPEQHYLGVTVEMPPAAAAAAGGPLDVRLPVWNALYQVRDFAQYVTEVRLAGGHGRIEKIEKSVWRVTAEEAQPITLQYRVFADQPGPFGMQLDSGHAFLNPAQLLVYSEASRALPVELRFTDLPAGWKIATALPERAGAWEARNYDHLADSPVEISAFDEAGFSAGGGNYRIVVHAARGAYSMDRLREMVERIVTHETAMMRDMPFPRFTFLYHFREGGGGGMEHAESTAIDAGPQRGDREAEPLANVTAHEFFHLWNVKRIRPRSLEPVDYTGEQYTRALWFSEGLTSTYGSYTLLRAGLISRERYLEQLARNIRELEARPAHLSQSLEESSLDAWLEKYGYYGSPERSISYYQKGELVGVLLDLAIRNATANRRGLDDVMRYLNEHYAKAGKWVDERRDIQTAAEAVAGQPLGSLFDLLVRSAQPVPYAQFLGYAGLTLREQERTVAGLGFHTTRRTARGYAVDRVEPGGPAEKAGVRAGDEVLQLNGRPLRGRSSEVAAGIRPGSKIRLKLRRDGSEFEVRYKTERAVEKFAVVERLPNPSPLQQKILEGWLSGATE